MVLGDGLSRAWASSRRTGQVRQVATVAGRLETGRLGDGGGRGRAEEAREWLSERACGV